MFARIVEITPKLEKKDEFFQTVRLEILPILRKQHGFLDFLPFVPENKNDRFVYITLWTEKAHAEKYVKEVFPKVENIVKPFLAAPITYKMYTVDTTVNSRLLETMSAVA